MERIQVNGREYPVLKLLGKGKGGYSYLALNGEEKVEAELRDYRRLRQVGITVPELLDVDVERERLVKEYIEGPTVYELVREGDLPARCMDQVRQMCALLRPANLNIDYSPTNFVLRGDTLYYIDYECNDYMDEWSFENWGIRYWSQTPELLRYAEEHP